MDHQAGKNTDTEIWRAVPGDAYSPSIHATCFGSIGINVAGRVLAFERPGATDYLYYKIQDALRSGRCDKTAPN